MSVQNDEHLRPPITSKISENGGKIRELIHEDRRRKIHQLSHMVGINYVVRQEILIENLTVHRVLRMLSLPLDTRL